MPLELESCRPLRGAQHRLDPATIAELLGHLPGWRLHDGQLLRTLRFPDFATALAATNQIGSLAETQQHHPDLELGWGRLRIAFSTHDVGGLSRNDFVCAAKINCDYPPTTERST